MGIEHNPIQIKILLFIKLYTADNLFGWVYIAACEKIKQLRK